MKSKNFLVSLAVAFILLSVSACTPSSFPEERIHESLKEIAQKEYGIENIDIKITGKTISVYLPLKKLFATNFEEAVLEGKVPEMLFEPTPEALDKIEDLLFSISRVLLSTDMDLDFYVMQATDLEETGMQIVLKGYIDDVKRVRLWDIPRSEYRKRMIYEIQLNKAALWHRPVRRFFKDLNEFPQEKIKERYFNDVPSDVWMKEFFFESDDPVVGEVYSKREWEIVDLKSLAMSSDLIVIYAKVINYLKQADMVKSVSEEQEYLFEIMLVNNKMEIKKIIPFSYLQEETLESELPFSRDILRQSLDSWEKEFNEEELELAQFLADQLSRRVHALLGQDERIFNTFENVRLIFNYYKNPEKHFSLAIEARLKDINSTDLVSNEDMLYLLDAVSKEFAVLMRSYSFNDFDYLSLDFAQDPTGWFIKREDLDLFRRGKVEIKDIISS